MLCFVKTILRSIPWKRICVAFWKAPILQKLPVTAHEISVNNLVQSVSHSTNRKATSVDSTRHKTVYQSGWSFSLTCQRPYHCLTDRVIFFYQVFDPVRQWPHHSLTDRVFFIFLKSFSTKTSVAIPRSVRPVFFKDILDWDVNDHTMVSQTGSVVWSLTS